MSSPVNSPTPSLRFGVDLPEFDLDKMSEEIEEMVRDGMPKLRRKIRAAWDEKASQIFSASTQKRYMQGVRFSVDKDSLEIDVVIKGWLPVALETGAPRFDMKPGLLQGRDSRVIPMHDGGFRTVSIRSPQDSWWHPGLQATDLAGEVQKEIPDMLPKVFTRKRVGV